MNIVRRYILTPEDREPELDSELREGIQLYNEVYAPIVSDSNIRSRELGAGRIGKVTLFEPPKVEAFVRKTFKGAASQWRFDGLSVPEMNHWIDLRIMRALKGLPIAAQLQAFSFQDLALVNSFRPGRQVSEPFVVSQIPDHQISAWISGMGKMHDIGVTIDSNPANVLYDRNDGFSVIDALPSSRLITPDTPEQFAEMQQMILSTDIDFDADPLEWDLDSAVFNFMAMRNTYDSGIGLHLFGAVKFMAYALVADLPPSARTSTADEFVHELGFQRVFVPCLYRVLGELKEKHPERFDPLLAVTREHLDRLSCSVAVTTGWNSKVEYYPAPAGKALIDDPQIRQWSSKILGLGGNSKLG